MPPVSCPDIYFPSTFPTRTPAPAFSFPTCPQKFKKRPYNLNMTATRWLFFILSIAAGIGLGLYYGWVLSPVEYVDTAPASLRADFRADYVLMVAETYQKNQDIEEAARRLATLGSEAPEKIATNALVFAHQYTFHPDDITLLQNLVIALQAWKPDGNRP